MPRILRRRYSGINARRRLAGTMLLTVAERLRHCLPSPCQLFLSPIASRCRRQLPGLFPRGV